MPIEFLTDQQAAKYGQFTAAPSERNWSALAVSGSRDAIVILAGGRHPDGRLTDLTEQRLAKGAAIFLAGAASNVLVMSGRYAMGPRAIRFPDVQALIAKARLITLGVPAEAVVAAGDDMVRDTITEALMARRVAIERGWSTIVLVTSDLHMVRARLIFERVLGDEFTVEPAEAPCGDLLSPEREAMYREIVSSHLAFEPAVIPDPRDWETWYRAHHDLYAEFADIDSRFRVDGKEVSQAYVAQDE